jgi:hypothetical protein
MSHRGVLLVLTIATSCGLQAIPESRSAVDAALAEATRDSMRP